MLVPGPRAGHWNDGYQQLTITEYVAIWDCFSAFSTGDLGIVEVIDRNTAVRRGGQLVKNFCSRLWSDERGQDIAEYAVMLAVILVIVVGTIRLIGSNANNVFSQVASAIPQ